MQPRVTQHRNRQPATHGTGCLELLNTQEGFAGQVLPPLNARASLRLLHEPRRIEEGDWRDARGTRVKRRLELAATQHLPLVFERAPCQGRLNHRYWCW